MLNIDVQGTRLEFEHSLVSLSKWESFYQKAFFAWSEEEKRTHEEMIQYFKFMLISPTIENEQLVDELLPQDHMKIVEYINSSQTATVVREVQQAPGPKENVTSELMYYWMVAFKIPFHPTETWHINRLMMLVRVCSIKQAPPEKMSAAQQAAKFRELNEQRRKQMGTSG